MTSLRRCTVVGVLALTGSACFVPGHALRHLGRLPAPAPPVVPPTPRVVPRMWSPPAPPAPSSFSETVVEPAPEPVVVEVPAVEARAVVVTGPTTWTVPVPEVVVEQASGGGGTVTFIAGARTMQVTVPAAQYAIQVNGVMPPPRPECDAYAPCPNAYYWDEARAVYVYFDGVRYVDALGTPGTYPLPGQGVYVTYPPPSYVAPTAYRAPLGAFRAPSSYRPPPANWRAARPPGTGGSLQPHQALPPYQPLPPQAQGVGLPTGVPPPVYRGGGFPSQGVQLPQQQAPSHWQGRLQPQQAPSPSQQTPSPSQQAPSPSQRAPSPSQRAPSPSQRAPSPSQQAPSQLQQAPSRSQRAPSPSQQAPSQLQQAPSQSQRAPSQPHQAPSQSPGSSDFGQRLNTSRGGATHAAPPPPARAGTDAASH